MVDRIRQGEVYWVDFGTPVGSEPGYRRPCVVVQSNGYNDSAIRTTVVCTITSNQRRGDSPGNVPLRKGDANLPRASVVNVSQIFTVDKSRLREKTGSLPLASMNAVMAGLARVFERP